VNAKAYWSQTIDIAERILSEDTIELEDVCGLLRISMATARRHLLRGLEHIRTGPRPGGKILTSRQAVMRFVSKMSGPSAAQSTGGSRTSSARQKELDKAARECEALAV
jgi:predicted site-specific integrase-resolvase